MKSIQQIEAEFVALVYLAHAHLNIAQDLERKHGPVNGRVLASVGDAADALDTLIDDLRVQIKKQHEGGESE